MTNKFPFQSLFRRIGHEVAKRRVKFHKFSDMLALVRVPAPPVLTGYARDAELLEHYKQQQELMNPDASGFHRVGKDGFAVDEVVRIAPYSGRVDLMTWLRASMHYINQEWDGCARYVPQETPHHLNVNRRDAMWAAAFAHVYGVRLSLPDNLHPTSSDVHVILPDMCKNIRKLYPDAPPDRADDRARLAKTHLSGAHELAL